MTKNIVDGERDPSTQRQHDVEAQRRVRELIARHCSLDGIGDLARHCPLEDIGDLAWFEARMRELEDLRADVIELREAGAESTVCLVDDGALHMRSLATVGAFVRVTQRTLNQYGSSPSFQHFIANTLSRQMAKESGICSLEQAWVVVRRWLDEKEQHDYAVKRLKDRRLP